MIVDYLLLAGLAGLVWEKNTVPAENLQSYTSKPSLPNMLLMSKLVLLGRVLIVPPCFHLIFEQYFILK